jgi:hypothetical protein
VPMTVPTTTDVAAASVRPRTRPSGAEVDVTGRARSSAGGYAGGHSREDRVVHGDFVHRELTEFTEAPDFVLFTERSQSSRRLT